MYETKKIHRFLLGAMVLMITLLLASCTKCPPSPIPKIAIQPAGISITSDSSVATASQVFISSFDSLGNALDTITTAPGQELLFENAPTIRRPILFKFVYKTVAGKIIVEDAVRIQDGKGDDNGVLLPDMDVIVGRMTPALTACPTMTNLATGVGEVIFAFRLNTRYMVTMAHPGGQHEILLMYLEPPPIDTFRAGKVRVFKNDSYPATCVTNPTTSHPGSNDRKKLDVTMAQSTTCRITSLDSVSTTYPRRQVKVTCSDNRCTITVQKQQ